MAEIGAGIQAGIAASSYEIPPPRFHGRESLSQVVANVEKVIVGKSRAVTLAMVAILAEGHLLLEDVPGVGKTMLVRALSRSLDCSFQRVQFTPDLLPSDITGVSIYNQKTQEFIYRPGPVMSNILLADEINRASPKTQSALLEAMEERRVTVDGVTYPLPQPFLVMATQNPVEYEGTFPLPESQLDRFLLRLSLGYPGPRDEAEILFRVQEAHPIDTLEPVIDLPALRQMQAEVRGVRVSTALRNYIVQVAGKTREHPGVLLGVSPRGSIGLMRTAQALAYIEGRDYVIPDDIKALVPSVFGHRLVLRSEASLEGLTPESLLAQILQRVPVPLGRES